MKFRHFDYDTVSKCIEHHDEIIEADTVEKAVLFSFGLECEYETLEDANIELIDSGNGVWFTYNDDYTSFYMAV